jgi:hypothetical protein
MLSIPIEPADPAAPRSAEPTTSVLVIGRSEKVLKETVDLLRQSGRAAGATNDFDHLLATFDVASLDLVVFGGMVPPEKKEVLRADLATANPTITFLQGLAGIPGLIVAQVEAATAPPSPNSASVTYDTEARAITISLRAPSDVRAVAFWGTAFVPPDPESTSRPILEGTMEEGTHTISLPPFVPDTASFLAVHIETDVHTFLVGPMPRGTTLAAPPTGGGD